MELETTTTAAGRPPEKWYELGPFVIFDLETTGMSATNDRIVEIAAVGVDTDNERTRFHSLVNPRMKIPFHAKNVHGISDENVADAPTFHDIAPRFLEFADGATLVAHNARFDLSFLQESLARTGHPLWRGKTMDSIKIIKNAYPGLPSYSLQNLRATFNLGSDSDGPAHRAFADVEWTLEIFEMAMRGLLKGYDSAIQDDGV
ncbi:MAG: 3'-5' exonuclease [Kiritimatiellaeota bacterium]|nr:3'-5' exonuclease [Kiritimatiellota bacterium]